MMASMIAVIENHHNKELTAVRVLVLFPQRHERGNLTIGKYYFHRGTKEVI